MTDGTPATVSEVAKEVGVSERTARHRMAASDAYDALPAAQKKVVDKGTSTLATATREHKRKAIIANLDDLKTRKVKKAAGLYDVVVIDPPWPMKKIEREKKRHSDRGLSKKSGQNVLSAKTCALLLSFLSMPESARVGV